METCSPRCFLSGSLWEASQHMFWQKHFDVSKVGLSCTELQDLPWDHFLTEDLLLAGQSCCTQLLLLQFCKWRHPCEFKVLLLLLLSLMISLCAWPLQELYAHYKWEKTHKPKSCQPESSHSPSKRTNKKNPNPTFLVLWLLRGWTMLFVFCCLLLVRLCQEFSVIYIVF